MVNVDHVSSVCATDEPQAQGATRSTQHCLIFALSGHSTRYAFAKPEDRDAAFRAFCDFANARQRDSSKSSPTVEHEASLVRRSVGGGHTIFIVTGCTCGWRAPGEGDPEDALAFHLAAMTSSDTRDP